MKRVLIADDDVLVCRYLSQLIDWNAAGYELVGMARDGSQALTMIEQLKPQILITDIEMPVLNGIDLLKKVKAAYGGIKILILSCHDDFIYVKEAMRQGADEYFLKDELTGEKLLEMLREISADLGDVKADPKEVKIREQQEVEEKQILQLLGGTLEKLGDFSPDAVIAVHMTDYEDQAAARSTEQREEFYRAFASVLREQIPEMVDGKVCHVRAGWFAILLQFEKQTGRQEQQYQMMEMGSRILHKADKHFGIEVYLGMAEMQETGREVSAGWELAKNILGYTFYKRGRIFCSWQEKPLSNKMPEKAAAFLEQAEELKARRNPEQIYEATAEALAAFEKEQPAESVVASWLRSADRTFGVESRPLPKQFAMLEDICKDYVAAVRKRIADSQQYSESVVAVIRYIQENYRNNISLNAAANAVHLTPTYLSFIFHKETNITFSDYLQAIRIDHAKELLISTDEKIREIGYMVGYNDYRHFCKIFKKITTLTPQEYRKYRKKV